MTLLLLSLKLSLVKKRIKTSKDPDCFRPVDRLLVDRVFYASPT